MDQPAQRRNIHAPVSQHLPAFIEEFLDCRLLTEQTLHPLVIHIHDRGKCHLPPDILGLLNVPHADQRTVQRTHGGPGHGIELHPGFHKGLPRPDLVCAARTAAI